MNHIPPLLPENAPFGADERAWLNGWLAGYFARRSEAAIAAIASDAIVSSKGPEEYPWHDMTMPLEERIALAEGRPLAQRLMAAMAQQDCGQCGYLCNTYADAIASGAEKSLIRCVPGGKATSRVLKELMEITVAPVTTPIRQSATYPTVALGDTRPPPVGSRFASAARLNGNGSAKDTRHVVFDWVDGGSLAYEVGDSLGICATNCAETVSAIIEQLRAHATDDVDCPDGTRRSLREALSVVCDIGRPTDEAVEVLASRARDIGESQRLQALAEGYPGAQPEDADLLELLLTFPSARPPVQELILALGVLQPRLYSIASSPKYVRGSVHLTVAVVRWEKRGRLRKGIASTFLAERAAAGEAVPVFVQPSASFRLAASPDAPIIMIGPGTGVAPFRAFLQERRAIGARGRNWLFFGEQYSASDFLYQEELTSYSRDGLLTRLDLAFSRDQPERVYVQQCMRERAAELCAWLQEGAHLYVCGAAAMGRDVDASLAAIVARQGNMTGSAAKTYLAALAREGRYQRDVY